VYSMYRGTSHGPKQVCFYSSSRSYVVGEILRKKHFWLFGEDVSRETQDMSTSGDLPGNLHQMPCRWQGWVYSCVGYIQYRLPL